MGIAGDIAIIVVAALIGGLLAQITRLPIMLGYIVAGIAVGPHTLGPTVVHVEDVEVLADIGVALLLFTVGLEFPVERLASVKKIALIGTPLQILLSILLGIGIGLSIDWPFTHSLWLGCLISVSSTMVVLKILADRGYTGTLSSRVMTAILIVQDLAVIPMMILLPAVGDLDKGLTVLAASLGNSILFVSAMMLVGTKLLPWLMAKVAACRSRELFLVTVLAIGLGIGYATYALGLSFAFGAFLAGLVLSRSDFNHQALSEIVPLRDLFTLLFFVSVGMLIEPRFVLENWHTLTFLILAVFIGKSLIFGITTRWFGYVNVMPIAVGLYMFQIGEFAFVLARIGIGCGAIDKEVYLHILTLAAATMTLTPFAARLADPIYQWWRKSHRKTPVNTIDISDPSISNHLVLVGYGAIGAFLATALRRYKEKLLILEEHPERVRAAKKAGFNTIGGDATSEIILQAANLPKAKLAIITVSNPVHSTLMLRRMLSCCNNLQVLSRASSLEQMKSLEQLGAVAALVPEYEAGLGLLHTAIVSSGHDPRVADLFVARVRRIQYAPMQYSTYGDPETELEDSIDEPNENSDREGMFHDLNEPLQSDQITG